MGAKGWMLIYADGDVRPILQAASAIDREATRELVEQLYPSHHQIEDGTLAAQPNPPEGHVYAGWVPGLTVICTDDAALDRPSELDRRFVDAAAGRILYLHAMHSVVDWFAFAVWNRDGTLRRALSLAPDEGIIENVGDPLRFEAPYWAGKRKLDSDTAADYPLEFHPLELAEDALRALFGFNYEGEIHDDDPGLGRITLMGFQAAP